MSDIASMSNRSDRLDEVLVDCNDQGEELIGSVDHDFEE